MVRITTPETMTAAGIHSSEMSRLEAQRESTLGIRAASTMSS